MCHSIIVESTFLARSVHVPNGRSFPNHHVRNLCYTSSGLEIEVEDMHEDIPAYILLSKPLFLFPLGICLARDLYVIALSFHPQDFRNVACRVHTDHVGSVHLHSDKILDQAGHNTGHPEIASIEDPARGPVALDLGNTLIDYHSSEPDAEEKRVGDANDVERGSGDKVL
jgi:hypothetical protein